MITKYLIIGFVSLGSLVGAYFYGIHMESYKAQAEIAALQTKYQKEESELLGMQTVTNTKIVTQLVTRTVTIHDQTQQLQQQISALPDSEFLSNGWLRIADSSATGAVSSPTSPTDDSASTITAKQELNTVTGNYAICNQNAAELTALQAWWNQTKANIQTTDKTKGK